MTPEGRGDTAEGTSFRIPLASRADEWGGGVVDGGHGVRSGDPLRKLPSG